MHSSRSGQLAGPKSYGLLGPQSWFTGSSGAMREHVGFRWPATVLLTMVVTIMHGFCSGKIRSMPAEPPLQEINNHHAWQALKCRAP